ncbi:hypothetical protein ACQW02_05250 [Humitalea sp. 24SJ18S-53]|uniref:hypothetical protein n=1 Tax=Humitalea sp. 24SJ18S-53 TaxID=3422307 RepID=UPI003D669982
MRIAIVGTSNSVGKNGYVSGMQSGGLVTLIRNFSLGHSTSVVLPFTLGRFDPADFDFCIFDFVVNEQPLIERNANLRSAIEDRLRYILHQFASTNCIPVMLVMPSERGLEKGGLARSLYLDFSKANGIPFFDGYEYLSKMMQISSLPRSDFFRDPDHLTSWVATSLGMMMAEQLHSLIRSGPVRMRSLVQAPDYRYELAALHNDLGGQDIHRKTSLVGADFRRFERPGQAKINLNYEGAIIGLGLNLSQTKAKIIFDGGHSQAAHVSGTRYFDPTEKQLTFVVRPINKLPYASGTVKISWKSLSEHDNTIFEFHGFSVELPRSSVEILQMNIDGDLERAIPDSSYRLAATIGVRMTTTFVEQKKRELAKAQAA